MAKILTFYDDKHEYQVGEEILPSVSEILRFITREMYDNINQYTLDQAADRGKRVHAATENLDRYGEVQIDADIQPYVEAYIKWRREYDPQWTRIEYAPRSCPRHRSGRSGRWSSRWDCAAAAS